VRVARETYVLLARFRDDKVRNERGSRQAPPFAFREDSFELVLRRSLVMMVVASASAVLAMVAIMRRGLVSRLRLGGTRVVL
jgi:hypothetical protein